MIFEDNRGALGGAVLLEEASPTFEDCVFRGNAADGGGGALRASNSCSPRLSGCHFIDNCAHSGAAVYFASDCAPLFEDCTFVGNQATVRGGAIAAFASLPRVTGCTFHENGAIVEGGTICFWLGTIEIERSIIAFGTCGESIFLGVQGQAQLTCCNIFGNVGGDWIEPFADQLELSGNLCEDPLYCPGVEEALYLREDSPCAPFTPPNADCDRIGAWPVGCLLADCPAADRSSAGLRIACLAPNPSHGTLRIDYSVPASLEDQPLSITISDANGRVLRRLGADDRHAGLHHLIWDGLDAGGKRVSGGVYFCRIRSAQSGDVRSFLLLP